MTLDELLLRNETTTDDLEQYFKSVGLNHVKRRELDKIIEHFGLVVFKLYCFSEVYKIVLERETSRRMHLWTTLIGVTTVLYTFITFLMFFK